MSKKAEVTPYFGVPWPEVNDGLTYHDIVPPTDAGLTLIEFYFGKYKSSAPLQGWLQRIQNKQITIDGKVTTLHDTKLRAGAELVYHRLPWREPDAPYLLQVLFEDDYLIAVNKPSGLQVLPGGLYQQRTVLTQLQWHVRMLTTTSSGCQKTHPVPVHRLGRGTSGILLCAKTKLSKSRLAAYFADGTSVVEDKYTNSECNTMRKICKIYRALVSGVMDVDEVVIKQSIGRIKYPGVAKGLYVASPSGKPALSSVRALERDLENSCTLVQVEIQSGRPHQIRIHLSFIGLPLIEARTEEEKTRSSPISDDQPYIDQYVDIGRALQTFVIRSSMKPYQFYYRVCSPVLCGQSKAKNCYPRVNCNCVQAELLGDPLYVFGGQPKCSHPELTGESFEEDGGYQRPENPVPGDCGYNLHAHQIVLVHPITNELIKITAPLPAILQTQEERKKNQPNSS